MSARTARTDRENGTRTISDRNISEKILGN